MPLAEAMSSTAVEGDAVEVVVAAVGLENARTVELSAPPVMTALLICHDAARNRQQNAGAGCRSRHPCSGSTRRRFAHASSLVDDRAIDADRDALCRPHRPRSSPGWSAWPHRRRRSDWPMTPLPPRTVMPEPSVRLPASTSKRLAPLASANTMLPVPPMVWLPCGARMLLLPMLIVAH